MNVYLADKLPAAAVDALESFGCTVTENPGATATELASGVGDAMVLIVRSTKVNADCIANSPSLSLVIRAGAGVNNIDLDAASRRGVFVANCPGQNAIAVAELAFGLILSADRRIPDNVADFRGGVWNKALYSKADGVYGKTLGILGTGGIGREVIRRAQAFGLNVIAWSRSLTPEGARILGVERAESPGAVAAACDILSVHVALTADTRGLVSREVLAALHDGALVVNTARAEVVDEDALYEELSAGRLNAAVDVFGGEPEGKGGEVSHRFAGLANCYVTHHIGASTDQAQIAVAMDAADIVRGYMQEGTVRNWINRCRQTLAPWQLVVRHFDRPGVLANVLSELKSAGINVQELDNVIFDGKETASCSIQLDAEPGEAVLEAIRSRTDEVISAALLQSAST
ncbi:MAG: hydroxyacid dehydrogenase [Spirochaetaceae bacterium]|nr:MAG: hydroxyacid dehydrogenase [Spirochaetaceae bacterium]